VHLVGRALPKVATVFEDFMGRWAREELLTPLLPYLPPTPDLQPAAELQPGPQPGLQAEVNPAAQPNPAPPANAPLI
jgi:hypothetical protein